MRYLTAVATASVILLAACGSVSPGTQAAGESPSPVSCKAQYEAWRRGPAKATALRVMATFRAVQAEGNAGDIPRVVTALKRTGAVARAAEAYPPPSCADPHRYWHQVLVEIQAGADNAGTGTGLGALLLAKIPLEKVPGLLRRWAAEVKQATGITVSAP